MELRDISHTVRTILAPGNLGSTDGQSSRIANAYHALDEIDQALLHQKLPSQLGMLWVTRRQAALSTVHQARVSAQTLAPELLNSTEASPTILSDCQTLDRLPATLITQQAPYKLNAALRGEYDLALAALSQALRVADEIAQRIAGPAGVGLQLIIHTRSTRPDIAGELYAIPQGINPALQNGIDKLDLPFRSSKPLIRAGIRTLYLLSFLSKTDLWSIKNLGKPSIDKLEGQRVVYAYKNQIPELIDNQHTTLDFLPNLLPETRTALGNARIGAVGGLLAFMISYNRGDRYPMKQALLQNIYEGLYPLGFLTDAELKELWKLQTTANQT